ncbi:sigma-54-dependent Fis family transcriptional regulator [Clostridium formicaceticum]|uniref:Acetoin dehydrogenase operon transcriptional activator AcoR n=1 Tax=Clostridium formicaceticum TaxID=1497 RepID=A0AAC9RLB0_9CLOT|nr:sigma-54-dependent Fis family transcriptional regulator [Clostridium formicaceticum]AOY76004.1 hypothetical protein BJL90_08895 [Clostridium formicaceticum]ARE86360.1 Acetoin dehydrogenase operon transcriptional activator AcoR [Clostridium formicaceticum]
MSNVWKDFVVNEDSRTLSQVPTAILNSWKRCKHNNVNHIKVSNNDILPAYKLKELQEKEEIMVTVGKKVLHYIYKYLNNKNYIVLISNKDGYILDMIGDLPFMNKVQKISLSPGANWREEFRGTNTVGTIIVEQTPLTVLGWEHYAKPVHFLNCWAAPIFNADGNFAGVLNISGVAEAPNKTLISIAQKGAKMIEQILKIIELESNFYFDRLKFEAIAQKLHDSANKLNTYSNDNISLLNKLIVKNENLSKIEYNQLTDFLLWNRKWLIFNKVDSINIQENKNICEEKTWCGRSEKIHQVFKTATKAALTNSNILIQGESGTGKEIVARFIHNKSSCSNGPFIPLNCAAIPNNLIESELFGYSDGAFTGAKRGGQLGKFEEANNGTIFLDEIGDMPLNAQTTLLRILQNKEICRIGESKYRKINIRIIAATNSNLKELVAEKKFRLDLYYRLNVISIKVPPLRERLEDLWDLIPFFVEKYCKLLNKPFVNISQQVYKYFLSYDWPGNIRQLENYIESMIALCDGNLLTENDFPDEFKEYFPEIEKKSNTLLNLQHNDAEYNTLSQVLAQTKGNVTKASNILGISRVTMYRKMKKYNLIEK